MLMQDFDSGMHLLLEALCFQHPGGMEFLASCTCSGPEDQQASSKAPSPAYQGLFLACRMYGFLLTIKNNEILYCRK